MLRWGAYTFIAGTFDHTTQTNAFVDGHKARPSRHVHIALNSLLPPFAFPSPPARPSFVLAPEQFAGAAPSSGPQERFPASVALSWEEGEGGAEMEP